uniref:Uncharacterized protein n=1 Tax=viral metagenome TaxID=1070528 RepID=A0A6M3KG04_9ZZZZ
MKIDHEKLDSIRRELEDIVYPDCRNEQGKLHLTKHDCKFTLRQDKTGAMSKGIKQYESREAIGIDCYLNPTRIHTENQLRKHVDWLREQLA